MGLLGALRPSVGSDTFTAPSLVIVGKALMSRLYVSTYFEIRELSCLSFQAADWLPLAKTCTLKALCLSLCLSNDLFLDSIYEVLL